MKLISKISLAAMLALGSLNAAAYAPDPAHSNIGFSVKHLKVVNVYGVFKSYNAVIDYDKSSNELKALEADIEIKSIDTRNDKRDAHLKNDDFFAEPKFPNMKFKMTKFQKEGGDEGKVHGEITIMNVTKPIVLDFKFNGENKNMSGKDVIGIELEGEILRSDFNLGGGFGDNIISNKVELQIDIEAIKQ